MGSRKTDVLYSMHQQFYVFCKYWPDDGPLRPELVANSSITIKYYIVVSGWVHV